MSLKEKAHIMDEAAMERALVRIAHQIVEKNHGTDHLCLVGIKTRGVPLAQRLGRNISRLEGVDIPVVDDVIFTGRTARAAMEAVIALGRPAKIQLFALIDRGHAELPIKANYVGKHIPTARREIVSVKVAEQDGENSVTIWSREKTDS